MHKHVDNEGRFEKSDVHLKQIVIVGIVLVVTTAITFFVGVEIMGALNRQPPTTDFKPSKLASEHEIWESDVRLQADPPAELAVIRGEQHHDAGSYGTISAEQQIFRIPVSKAMEVIANDGRFPAFPALPEVPAAIPAPTR